MRKLSQFTCKWRTFEAYRSQLRDWIKGKRSRAPRISPTQYRELLGYLVIRRDWLALRALFTIYRPSVEWRAVNGVNKRRLVAPLDEIIKRLRDIKLSYRQLLEYIARLSEKNRPQPPPPPFSDPKPPVVPLGPPALS